MSNLKVMVHFIWTTKKRRPLSIAICENRIPVVRKYIANQEKHHEKISYDEEFKSILKAHGLYVDPAKAD